MNNVTEGISGARTPSVSIVFLAFNRRDELRLSLTKTLSESDYEGPIDVIVVDNASVDGTAEMLAEEFPAVQVIRRGWNSGISGWNDGFAVAGGDYVLALDDDCYLPADGLRRAVEEAESQGADLVSFAVESLEDPSYRFDLDECRTGLFSFWGCAVLMRREVLAELGGYDPEIFVWANELEFMLRFFDRGFRHLHLPVIVAIHAKAPGEWREGRIPERPYRVNAHNLAYVAAKLLTPRDAVETLIAFLIRNLRDGVKADKVGFAGARETLKGFAHGLKHRQPVRPEVSRTFRHNFEVLASPWWVSRPLSMMVKDAARGRARRIGHPGRRDDWIAERARFYPERSGVLDFGGRS